MKAGHGSAWINIGNSWQRILVFIIGELEDEPVCKHKLFQKGLCYSPNVFWIVCYFLYISVHTLCVFFFPCMCFPFSVSINSRLASSLGNLYAASDDDETKMTSSSTRTGFSVSHISSHLSGSLQLPHRNNHELNNNLYNRNSSSGNNLSSQTSFHSTVTDEYASTFLYGPYNSSSTIPDSINSCKFIVTTALSGIWPMLIFLASASKAVAKKP